MADLAQHWNDVFVAKDDPQLGWYERDVSQTLGFLELVPGHESATIFLPGAGTSLLVDALLERGARLVLNDISDEALRRLQRRIGERTPAPLWLHHDIAKPLPPGVPACDIWLDRAVLHFLLTEDDVNAGRKVQRATVNPDGLTFTTCTPSLLEFAAVAAALPSASGGAPLPLKYSPRRRWYLASDSLEPHRPQ
jgi:hypothetical protein